MRWDDPHARCRCFYRDREHQERQFRRVIKYLPPGPKTILDVGCGYGDLTQWLPPKYSYKGIEADEELYEAAVELYPDFAFAHTTELTDADVIVCVAALQNEIVEPRELILDMLDHSRLLIVSTVVLARSKWDEDAEEFFPSWPDLVDVEPEDDFMVIVTEGNL